MSLEGECSDNACVNENAASLQSGQQEAVELEDPLYMNCVYIKMEPEIVMEEPESEDSICKQDTEYLTKEPEYLTKQPEYLTKEPEYLTKEPEYVNENYKETEPKSMEPVNTNHVENGSVLGLERPQDTEAFASFEFNIQVERLTEEEPLACYTQPLGSPTPLPQTPEFNQLDLNPQKQGQPGAKLHTCEICQKQFTRLNTLKEHERIHAGTKPYSCEICHKPFRRLGTLKTHKLVHAEVTMYPCDKCDKTFMRMTSLKIHKRIHTGQNLYSCEICNIQWWCHN